MALIASTFGRAVARVDRLLTYTVSLAGLTALVVGVYAVVVLALARTPEGSERTLLLASMGAAALAALIWLPARRWLSDTVNRVVYGERVSPDEALRTWGSRLTRAIPMDELLLQLCESLRKTMGLVSAEVWTGSAGSYDWATGVPHRTPPTLLVGDKERPVVARAGVSGGRWLEIWLPELVAQHPSSACRVAPLAHQGELLGLIVCRRPDDGEAFTEEDDRVLAELARQVGLALHNMQLDSALQASLAELQTANDELRASRSRIVAAGDAERRKLERNLHDGAQQHLVALAVKLRLAKDAVEDEPDAAMEMMDELRGDIQDAIQELRALAHGIFPPLLVSGGLAEALPAAGTPGGAAHVGGGLRRPLSRPRWRPPCTSAAWRRCRTPASTPATAPRPPCGCGRKRASCASRCATTAPASMPPGPGPASATASSTWPTGWAPSMGRSPSTPPRGRAPSALVHAHQHRHHHSQPQGRCPRATARGRAAPTDLPPSRRASYWRRRDEIAALAAGVDAPAATIDYTDVENGVWSTVATTLRPLWDRRASAGVLAARDRLALPTDRVPQLAEVDARLRPLTGFGYRAVAGLIPVDQFFEALANRTLRLHPVRALGGFSALHPRTRRHPRGDGSRQLPGVPGDRRSAPLRR